MGSGSRDVVTIRDWVDGKMSKKYVPVGFSRRSKSQSLSGMRSGGKGNRGGGQIGVGSVSGGGTSPTVVPVVLTNHSLGVQRNGSHAGLLDVGHYLHRYAAPAFVWDMRVFGTLGLFQSYRDGARALNPSMVIGAYWRASCFGTGAATIPPCQLTSGDLSEGWDLGVAWPGSTTLHFLDMTVSVCRAAVIAAAIANAVAMGLDGVSFDAMYYNIVPVAGFPISKADWHAAMLSFFSEAWTACQAANLKCFFNVAMNADDIPAGFAAIAPYADGIMTESPFYISVRGSAASELAAYVSVLDQGKWVFLVPSLEEEDWVLGYITETMKLYPKLLCASVGDIHHNEDYWVVQS